MNTNDRRRTEQLAQAPVGVRVHEYLALANEQGAATTTGQTDKNKKSRRREGQGEDATQDELSQH